MIKFLKFLFIPLLLTAAKPDIDPFLLQKDDHLKIIVNNRVLADVNGKAITLMDAVKRMDILFLKQFPEYTQSVNARYQFYQANWERILEELIEKELVLADSTEVKMEVSGADVRQEMENLFGPNIIVNLDKIGLSLDEATKIVASDIAIRRMMFLRVTSKALGKVTPQATRALYEKFVKENTKDPIYTYRVLTVRDAKGKEIAETILGLIKEKGSLQEAAMGIPQANISEIYNHTSKEIAPKNMEVLSKMQPGQISEIQAQQSRADNSTVYRILSLEKYTPGGAPTYSEVESRLKETLLDEYMISVHEEYVKRLKKHYAIKEGDIKIPDAFTPFTIK